MCFEWDERYFREQRELQEKKAREQVEELIKNAENTAKPNPVIEAFKRLMRQPRKQPEKEPS